MSELTIEPGGLWGVSDCEYMPACAFFRERMAKTPAVATLYADNFCRSVWWECARHQVTASLGAGAVPAGLYPNDQELASALIEQEPLI